MRHAIHVSANALSNPTPKPWYASVGVWGGLVSLAGSVLALLKIQVDPVLLDDIREWVLALAALIGAGVSLWGRLRATRPIRAIRTPLAGAHESSTASGQHADVNRHTRRMLVLFALLPLPALSGCQFFQSSAGAYVGADRATYDAVAPEYATYVATDPSLTPEQRARRDRTMESWRLRLEEAERAATVSNNGPLTTDD